MKLLTLLILCSFFLAPSTAPIGPEGVEAIQTILDNAGLSLEVHNGEYHFSREGPIMCIAAVQCTHKQTGKPFDVWLEFDHCMLQCIAIRAVENLDWL
jgi:hypothetical protein